MTVSSYSMQIVTKVQKVGGWLLTILLVYLRGLLKIVFHLI